jgi:hypothetical protein
LIDGPDAKWLDVSHHFTQHNQTPQHKKLKNLKLSRRAKLWLTFEEPEFRSVVFLGVCSRVSGVYILMTLPHPISPPPPPPHKPNTNHSYTARLISFLLNCCIFLSVIAFILSTMDTFK